METLLITDLPRTVATGVKKISRKRSCWVTSFTPGRTALLGWDDGSRDEYHGITDTGDVVGVAMTLDPDRLGDPFKQRYIIDEQPPNVVAVVRSGTSRGKPATPYVMLINIPVPTGTVTI